MKERLKSRELPELLLREEMLGILQQEEYGLKLPEPTELSFFEGEELVQKFCASKASIKKITAEGVVCGRKFSFPFYAVVPKEKKKYPFFVHINFRPDNPDRYQPTEEIVDNGFAVLTVCYKDVTSDDDDFTNGLSGVLFPKGERKSNEAGKIAMWAWAASRVLDYAYKNEEYFDLDTSIVCGHSRLGKTALLAAAFDERFKFSYSNDSGCSGAALARGTKGETVEDICRRFPFWFCENYNRYRNNEAEMPFDQHYLIASIAPRYVLIGSAVEDAWADPHSEQLCCVAASPAFENGFVTGEDFADVGDELFEGDIGYHLRGGTHYFSREDWLKLIKFVQEKKKNEKNP